MRLITLSGFNHLINRVFLSLFVLLLLFCHIDSYATNRQFLVAYAQDTMANDWRAAQVKQLEQAFSKYPEIKFIYTDAGGSTAKQIQDIEDLVYQKVDLLITSPRDGKLMTPVISRIYKSGLPVVLITRNIQRNDYTSFVAPDDDEIARKAARYIAKQLNGKGRIVMLRGVPTATTAIARTRGFVDEIKKYPGLKIVADKTANYLRNDALRAMDEIISEGVMFDAVYSQSDSMASGARLAMIKLGINPSDKLIVGIDYISEAQQAIKNGTQTASFLYPTSSKQAVEIVVKILRKQAVPKRVKVDTQLITKNNVDKVKPIF